MAQIQPQGYLFGTYGIDKLYHFIAYLCLTFPLTLARPRLTIWIFLGAITFGGSIEFIQYFFNRKAEWTDFIANGFGAIVGSVIARQIRLLLFKSDDLKKIKQKFMKNS